MNSNYYKDLIEDIIDINKNINIVLGSVDIRDNLLIINSEFSYHYSIIGGGNEILICESLENYDKINLDDGEYEFKAVLKWCPEDHHYGGYLDIEYIEFNFIQTFIQRERQIKLENLDINFF